MIVNAKKKPDSLFTHPASSQKSGAYLLSLRWPVNGHATGYSSNWTRFFGNSTEESNLMLKTESERIHFRLYIYFFLTATQT
jgi:hypothetical protein